MSRASLTKLAVPARSTVVRSFNRSSSLAGPFASIRNNGSSKIQASKGRASSLLTRAFSTTVARPLGLSPESEEPPAKEETTETTEYNVGGKPADLSVEEYNQLSDDYLNVLVDKMEQMQEDNEEVDCEYSVCLPLSLQYIQLPGCLISGHSLTCNLLCTTDNLNTGWCSDLGVSTKRYLYPQQATCQQANLAVVTH